jgi:hypothetical protein
MNTIIISNTEISRPCRDAKFCVSTTDRRGAPATAASRLNYDFKMIGLIQMIFLNHVNHIEITVQTNEAQ